MNELGALVEGRLEANGWTLANLLDRVNISAGEALGLFGPARLSAMPDQETTAALAQALGVAYREVVLAAASACGVAITPDAGRDVTLMRASNEQLLREMRRRLVAGRQHGDARRRRMAHLALVGQALAHEDEAG